MDEQKITPMSASKLVGIPVNNNEELQAAMEQAKNLTPAMGQPISTFVVKHKGDHTYTCRCGCVLRIDTTISVYEPQEQ